MHVGYREIHTNFFEPACIFARKRKIMRDRLSERRRPWFLSAPTLHAPRHFFTSTEEGSSAWKLRVDMTAVATWATTAE